MAGKDWKWFGHAGHLIISARCQFHLTTQVGDYLISTVGDFHPDPLSNPQKIDTVGVDRLYETMVFKIDGYCDCGCGLPHPDTYAEIDFEGYNTPKKANEGHLNFCKKYDEVIKNGWNR
jgi:hypothetical protein